MTALRRTASALHSLHRFFRVDIVVFCEGSDSVDYNRAIARELGNQTSLDVMFWSSVVQLLGTNKTYHFKSVGSKETLNAICKDIVDQDVSTISVCRDRDYDEILNRMSNCTRVCYSSGYSWENDVTHLSVVKSVILDFIGPGPQQTADLDLMESRFDLFRTSLPYWVEIDISLIRMRKKGIFDRKSANNCLDFEDHPSLRVAGLKTLLAELGYKTRPKRVLTIPEERALQVCFGKLVSKAIFHYAQKLFEKYNIGNIKYDQFMRLLISKTANMFNFPDLMVVSGSLRGQIASLN